MRTANDYIRSSRERANREHFNFVDSPQRGWNKFVQQPGWSNADGAAAPASSVKKSMPYIVNVSSASGAAVQNFDILGSYEYLNNPNYSFDAQGNLVVGAITISSGIPNVTYQQLLWQTQGMPYTVGLTYVSVTTPVAQLQQAYTIQTKDANGTQLTIPVIPIKDPYQQQNDSLVVNQEYRIDGFTKLTFAQVLPMAVFSVYFYPSDNIAVQRALSGTAATRNYGDPNIIRGIR